MLQAIFTVILGFFFIVMCCGIAKWAYIKAFCRPVMTKPHYFWNREEGAWWYYPAQVKEYQFSGEKVLSGFVIIMVVGLWIYMIVN